MVKDGIASFRSKTLIFKHIVGEESEVTFTFTIDNIVPLNKFLIPEMKNAKFKFSNEVKNYLLSIEDKGYRVDIELKRFIRDYGYLEFI